MIINFFFSEPTGILTIQEKCDVFRIIGGMKPVGVGKTICDKNWPRGGSSSFEFVKYNTSKFLEYL